MAVLRAWCSAVILAIHGTLAATVHSDGPSQDLIFGLVGQQWSSQAIAGVEDALDDINNNNTELLSGYKLKYFQHTPVSVIASEVILD